MMRLKFAPGRMQRARIRAPELLRDQVYDAVVARPGCTKTDLVLQMPTAKPNDIAICLRDLCHEGVLVRDLLQYRAAPTEPAPAKYIASKFIRPAPRARLMARR